MNESRKNAYRYLLYHNTLLTRQFQWLPSGLARYNPLSWLAYYQRGRRAGAVADWLHNMALYSSLDFEGFDEDRFWDEARQHAAALPHLSYYQGVFDAHLHRQAQGR